MNNLCNFRSNLCLQFNSIAFARENQKQPQEVFCKKRCNLVPEQFKTIGHKTISFFFIDVLVVRAAAKFFLLFCSCSCCWCLNFMLLLRKLLLTPIRLVKLSLKKKIAYDIVRKSWINSTWRLVDGSHVESSCWY